MKKKNGFTLFELLVSISIIGILTALGVVSYSNAQKKARDSRRIQDMDAVQKGAEQYYSQNNYLYPAAYTSGSIWTPASGINVMTFPTDPKSATSTYGCASGATCNTTGYVVCAQLETTGKGNADATGNFAAAAKDYYCVKNLQ